MPQPEQDTGRQPAQAIACSALTTPPSSPPFTIPGKIINLARGSFARESPGLQQRKNQACGEAPEPLQKWQRPPSPAPAAAAPIPSPCPRPLPRGSIAPLHPSPLRPPDRCRGAASLPEINTLQPGALPHHCRSLRSKQSSKKTNQKPKNQANDSPPRKFPSSNLCYYSP